MAAARDMEPIFLLQQWLRDAEASEAIAEPTAATLATVDEAGRPDARVVLVKGCDEAGLVFYTNLGSAKAHQLAAHPYATLCFYWMPLQRQVRVGGPVAPVSDAEADAYFATRPRTSQLGAWASKQSQPLEQWLELERRVAACAVRFGTGAVPRPPFWSGFRLTPLKVEFWQQRPFRLHERDRYDRTEAEQPWTHQRLYP